MTVSHDPLGTAVYFYFPTGNILSDRNHPLVATIQNLPFFYNYLHVRIGVGRGDTPRFYIALCLLQRVVLPYNHHPRDQHIKGNPPSQFPIKLLLRLLVVDVIAAPGVGSTQGVNELNLLSSVTRPLSRFWVRRV